MNKRVLAAMSGGVDSSFAAGLLKDKGYDCAGAIMRLCGNEGVADAEAVAEALGLPFYCLDKQGDFKEKVIDSFINDYFAALTPNPCIECNKTMKFGAFLDFALENGFDYIATGHYARIEYNAETGEYELLKAKDLSKDQSYVLYFLNQEQLSRILLPLGSFTKSEIRSGAKENGLANANKKDSQDICFVPDKNYAAFIEKTSGKKSVNGDFTDTNGRVLGTHLGIINYTIGQRKGLGIALGKPQFVISKSADNNTVVLGDEELLFHKKVLVRSVSFTSAKVPEFPIKASVKLRYSMVPQPATITKTEKGVLVEFENAVRAATAGQAAVFYVGDRVLGGGIIEKGEN